MGFYGIYPLVMTYMAIEHCPFIVDFLFENSDYQRVPDGWLGMDIPI